MSRTSNVILFLAAGLLGGMVSRYFSPAPIHAQAPPVLVQAQSFMLVNESGQRIGEFAVDQDGKPNLKLFEPQSNASATPSVIWSARVLPNTATLSNK
jgi:hypothetical protein